MIFEENFSSIKEGAITEKDKYERKKKPPTITKFNLLAN